MSLNEKRQISRAPRMRTTLVRWFQTGFPRLPLAWLDNQADEDELPATFRDSCYSFFCRWNLDTFKTWDWPVDSSEEPNCLRSAKPEKSY
jgi:hypothetical protein